MHTNTVAIVTSSSMIVVPVDTSVVLPIFVYHYCAMVCLQHAVFVSVIIELWSIVAFNLKRHRHCSCTKYINAKYVEQQNCFTSYVALGYIDQPMQTTW